MKTRGSGFVNVLKKSGNRVEVNNMETIDMEVKEIMDTPAKVKVLLGHTKNLGNYESLRIEVGVEIPCAPTLEAVELAYEEAVKWVDDKLEKKIVEFLG